MLDQHPERCPPITDVVLPSDVVAEESEHPGQRVANVRAAQVADMHLLGHIGRRVVDHDPLGPDGGLDAQTRVARDGLGLLGDEVVPQGQIDEPGAADLDPGTEVVEPGRLHHLARDLLRRPAHLLRQGERAVGLEVGPVGDPQHRVGTRRDRVERLLQPLLEKVGDVGHPSFSHGGCSNSPASGSRGQRATNSATRALRN